MELVTKLEHEKLIFSEFSRSARLKSDLAKLYEKTEGKYFDLLSKGVKFKSYVGLIQTRDYSISILPKTGFEGLNDNLTYKIFIDLLVFCGHLRKAPRLFNIKAKEAKQETLLDLFILSFLDEVEDLLHFGLLRGYTLKTENNPYLKGRLNVSKHISENVVNGTLNFNVTYQTYQFDNDFNSLIYMGIKHICNQPVLSRYHSKSQFLIQRFPKLKSLNINRINIEKYLCNRRLQKYHVALEIAYHLLSESNTSHTSGSESFTILYNMNTLFQEYIYKLACLNGNALKNEHRPFWTSNEKEIIKIKPDVVVKNGETNEYILEVKWVDWNQGSMNRGYLSQIYTYSKVYGNIPAFLVYPQSRKSKNESICGKFDTKENLCGGILFQSLVDKENKLNKNLVKIPENLNRSPEYFI